MYFDPAAMVMTLRLSKVKCGEYDLFFEKVHFGTLTYAYRHVRSWGSSSVGLIGVTTKKSQEVQSSPKPQTAKALSFGSCLNRSVG